MYFGVDYYPEHWVYPLAGTPEAPESRWQRDVELMVEAGVNVVRMGEFAWGLYEPEEGRFDFAWMRRAMDLFGQAGIKVVLGTPTAAPPIWLARKHPEILPVDAHGLRRHEGTRRAYCLNSNAYWDYSKRIITALAGALGAHPQLIAWQIGLGGHNTEQSFNDETRRDWHAWLKAKYESIARLNDLMGTRFWTQTVTDWEQVPMPQAAPTVHNPALVLDWMRFGSDTLVAYSRMQADLLRQLTPKIPVTQNLRALTRNFDHFDMAETLDFVSVDSNATIKEKPSQLACEIDMMRSLKKTDIRTPDGDCGFWVIEQKAGNVNWQEVNSLVRPQVVRFFTYQLISRGACGVLYFLWRQPRIGSEKFYGGVLTHDGRGDNRTYQEIKQVGQEIKLLAPVLKDTKVVADTCILLSHENEWNLKAVPQPNKYFNQREHVQLFYNALHDRNIPVDFARPTEDLSRYKLVFAPSLQLLAGGEADRLKLYVQNGGTLVGTFNTGLVDEHHIAPDTGFPHDLTDLSGSAGVRPAAAGRGEPSHLQRPLRRDAPAPGAAVVRHHRAMRLPGARRLREGLLRGPPRAHAQRIWRRPGRLLRHHEPPAFLPRPRHVAAPVVQPASAAQGARHRRSEPAPEGEFEDLFPPQPPELARAHLLLQADARFPHRPDLHGQLRPPAARRAGAGRTNRAHGVSSKFKVQSSKPPGQSPARRVPSIRHSSFVIRH
jgi:beta-galactosidase